ncbi:EAL domain-containing protein [Tistrella mobilis]|uniref:EAL domain-containing protein n=1 Tax=Tistrella mobilis TaxID=171437 RepID=UPI00355699A8
MLSRGLYGRTDRAGPGRNWLISLLLAAAVAGAALALAGGELVARRMSDAALETHLTEMVARSDEVADEVARMLVAANQDMAATCSELDLTLLRQRVFAAHLIRDVGRLSGDHILCTAAWGRLDLSSPLDPPDYLSPSGARVWTASRDQSARRLTTDMIAFGRTIVFISDAAYDFMRNADRLVMSYARSTGRVFRTSEGTPPDPLSVRAVEGGVMLHDQFYASACSRRFDVCIAAAPGDRGILGQPRPVFAGVALLGALAGAASALAATQGRRPKQSIEHDLRRALAAGRLRLVYQPVVRVRDGIVVGAEGLVRWDRPEGGEIPPDIFVPVAERTGLSGELARYVLIRALEEMAPHLTGPGDFRLALNVTTMDLLDSDIFDLLEAETRRLGIAPERIALEITERSTAEYQQLAPAVARYRRRGYRIHIDDFGTGYSSLAHLGELPVDAIKIDRLFTRAIGTGAISASIVPQIFALARLLGAEVIVEGIETEAQACYLAVEHPDALGQGWFFGRPVAAQDFIV